MTGARCTYWPAAQSPVDAGYDAVLWHKTGERWDGTSRLVLACHGHGGTANQYLPNHLSLGRHAQELVASGRYVVLATADRGDSWGGPPAMTGLDAALAWARARGAKAGRYGLLGYSMGGLAAANRLRADKANVAAAWTFAGALDAGYLWGANNATWTAELTAIHGSLAAQRAANRDPLATAQAAGYDGLAGPWRIVHSVDDTVVPVATPRAAAAALAANPRVSYLELGAGGHTGLFPLVAPADLVAFFDSGSWD